MTEPTNPLDWETHWLATPLHYYGKVITIGEYVAQKEQAAYERGKRDGDAAGTIYRWLGARRDHLEEQVVRELQDIAAELEKGQPDGQ